MATETLLLGKKCAACGAERKYRNMLYDPTTFEGYCPNPYVCNEDHPNSTKNIIIRQKEADLVSYEVANEAYRAHLLDNYTPEETDEMRRLLTKPVAFRILDPQQAQFVIDFKQEQGMTSVTDVIRFALEMLHENRREYRKEKVQKQVKKEKEEKTQAIVAEMEAAPEKKHVPDSLTSDSEWEF